MWQVLFLSAIVCAQTANLAGDLIVSGTVTCNDLTTTTLTTSGNLQVTKDVTVDTVTATTITTQQLSVRTITPPSGVLRIQGDLVISRTPGDTASFIQEQKWHEVAEDDFSQGEGGWSEVGTGSCGGEARFLGGHCLLSSQEVSKTYTLPPHTSVRVTGSYHMFDLWTGESGYLKADGQYVWSLMGYSYENGLDVCGGPAPDPRLGATVDVTFKHTAKHLELRFGSTLKRDPCEASYGVGEVVISTQ